MKCRFWILLSLMLMQWQALCQNFIVKKYNTNSGLISVFNTKTIQDANYFYYTCSFGGLLRFDGEHFKTFKNLDGLHNYRVTDICELGHNDFLICNHFDLYGFDGNAFSKINTGLPATVIYKKAISIGNGVIVVITNQGSYSITKDKVLKPFSLFGYTHIEEIQFDHDGSMVFYDSKTRTLVNASRDKVSHSLVVSEDINVTGLTIRNGAVLAHTPEGLLMMHGKSLKPYLPEGYEHIGASPMASFQDSKGRLWIVDHNGTLWIRANTKWENLSAKYEIIKIANPHFMEDYNKNVVLTSLIGIVLFRESYIYNVPIEQESNNNKAYSLSSYNKDTVCVGVNRDGLVLMAHQKKILWPLDNAKSLVNSTEIQECNFFRKNGKTLLYIRAKGLYNIIGRRLVPFCSVKADLSMLNKGEYDGVHDCFYAGGLNKVLRIYKDRIDTLMFDHIAPGLRAHSFLLMPDGTVLFTATHKHLIRIGGSKLEDITHQLGLEDRDFAVFLQGNSLWVSVLGVELREYVYDKKRLTLSRRITKEDGLIDVNIGNIVFDVNKNLWLNCFSGIYLLKTTNKGHQLYSKKVALLYHNDNAPLIEGIFAQDDKVYAPSTNSIYEIGVNELLKEQQPFSTYFSNVKANNVSLQSLLSAKKIEYDDGVYNFPPEFSSFVFSCNTVYYGLDDGIRYQYRLLDGNDEKWHDLIGTNILNFNNLQSGKYQLEVKSINDLNNGYYTSTKFDFVIRPPYYKTWWFRGLMSLIAISMIFAFIKRREKIKEKENYMALQMSELKLTALQSQMNPHFIFNSLNSIQNFIMQHKPLEAARYLSKFSKLMRRILNQSFSHLTSMQEIVETLKMYMELESFRFSNEFVWEIVMQDEEEIADVKLPPLLLQPYVENAIIHGLMPKEGTKKLSINIYVKDEALHCEIDDNGVGRVPKANDDGHISRGQKLTTDMLMTMKTLLNTEAQIIITDKKDDIGKPLGTTITIVIPITPSLTSNQ